MDRENLTALAADRNRLTTAVSEADLRVLLMVLVHCTGDLAWLGERYQPRRDVRLIADEDAGLSPDVREEIRAAAIEVLSADPTPVITDPGDELMLRMMSCCLGERVPEEYAPMMREELGFVGRDVEVDPQSLEQSGKHVLIVGAGVSGIVLGARLGRMGVQYTIVEANSEVGGTWLVNRYPGCGVDTPNHAYSFSIGSRYPWSRYFAPRDELLDYVVRAADELGVRPHIEFDTRLESARFDATAQQWIAQLSGPGGAETRAVDVLVSAIGQLSLPSIPTLPGADRFDGELFHSAHWPEDLSVVGKRVAIIGTGASAMQIVPTIADDVAALDIYQRSPQWARPIPRYHDPISEGAQSMLTSVPFYADWFRFTMLWRYGDGLLPYLRKDPDWEFPDRSLNPTNERHREEMLAHIKTELGDRTDLLAACVPDYPPYGKRILLDNGWYQALRKPQVELVTNSINAITPAGIGTVDGSEREYDVIVLATGFRVSQLAARLNLTGRTGVTLDSVWADDNPSAFLGIVVPEFPNLFIMQGPNTGLGHGGSAIFQSECQARYITGLIAAMAEQGAGAVEPTVEAHDRWNQMVDDEHEQLIWTHPGMSTYYRNAAGRVVSVSPWRLVDYWSMTHEIDEADLVFSSQL